MDLRSAFIQMGKRQGLDEEQMEAIADIGEIVHDTVTAAITTTCAANKILPLRERAMFLIFFNLPGFMQAHPVETLYATPDDWLRDITLWVRDTIQNDIAKENQPC